MNNDDKQILFELLLRFKNCLEINRIFNLTDIEINQEELVNIIIDKKDFDSNVRDSIILVKDNYLSVEQINLLSRNNTIIRIFEGNKSSDGYYLNYPSSNTKIDVFASWFSIKKIEVPFDFKVLAIVHVYNEEDVIEKTVNHLLKQGIDVYLLDNWSKDNTSSIISKLVKENSKRVFSEKYPKEKDNNCYDWYHQLEKTEELSKVLDYNWFIHYDADEYRITPWNDMSLREMIYLADSLGFNSIENTLVNFRITDEKDENIFMKDTFFEFGKTSGAFVQYKTWKKDRNIELKSSGGHIADIENRKVFPLKILNRHYPFRSIDHAYKKIYSDRNPRYRKEELGIGWHIQYNHILSKKDIVMNKDELILWDNNTIKNYFIYLFILGRKMN